MIEDLLHRIGSNADVDSAEDAILELPSEYKLVLELHYEWGLSRREIAAILDWSVGKVSQRLTRGATMLKYHLHPGAFRKAEALLKRPM